MSEARAKRRAGYSPIQRDTASLATRELEDAENQVNQALLSVTVKVLQLLSDHTIASKELERTLFALFEKNDNKQNEPWFGPFKK